MRVKRVKPFATEAALCAAFIAVLDDGWTAYGETHGWDILLARKADGFQIGVEAKLFLNPAVLNQALEGRSIYSTCNSGPDCRAVLVPRAEVQNGLTEIAHRLGITVIKLKDEKAKFGHFPRQFEPSLPPLNGIDWGSNEWHERAPDHRIELPEYVPDVIAGSAAPIQLTKWKIAAIKVAVILERRGYLTRADFKHVGIDHRRWVDSRWLKVETAVHGQRTTKFTAGNLPNFKTQHPRNYAEIAADAAKWMPPKNLLVDTEAA